MLPTPLNSELPCSMCSNVNVEIRILAEVVNMEEI